MARIGLLTTALGYAYACSRVPQLDVEDGQLAGVIQIATAAMYKIHMVGTPSTIAALSNAHQSLPTASLELMTRRALLRVDGSSFRVTIRVTPVTIDICAATPGPGDIVPPDIPFPRRRVCACRS